MVVLRCTFTLSQTPFTPSQRNRDDAAILHSGVRKPYNALQHKSLAVRLEGNIFHKRNGLFFLKQYFSIQHCIIPELY